jgi:hypothetical protein
VALNGREGYVVVGGEGGKGASGGGELAGQSGRQLKREERGGGQQRGTERRPRAR